MFISRIEVENFRSIIKGRAIITEGINFIHGPNGSGKTSLLEAIAMGLYGTEWIRGRYKLGDLVRRGASSALIRLEVVGVDGRKYLIQRVFTSDKTMESQTYVIDENGKRVAVRDREVTQFVINITGINMETFSELLYVRQGEIREIIRSGKKGEFRFDTLLRLDSIERARQDVVREGLKRIEVVIEGLKGKLSILNNELQLRVQEKEKLNEELNNLNNELKSLENELNNVNNEITKHKNRESELSIAEQNYIVVKQELESTDKQLIEASKSLETFRRNYNELITLASRLDEEEKLTKQERELKSKLEELEKRRDEIKERLASMQARKSRINEINKELNEITRRITELNNELERISRLKDKEKELKDKSNMKPRVEAEIERLKEELTRTNTEIEHINLEIRLLNESGDKCPVCGRPLSKDMADEIRNQRKAQLVVLTRKSNELSKQLSSLTALLEGIRETEEELKAIENQLSKESLLRQSLNELMERKDALTKELNETTILEINELRTELQSIETEVDKINKSIRDIENKRIEIAEIKGRLGGINELKETIKNLESKIQELQAKKEQLSNKSKELESKINELKSIRDKLNELNDEREKIMNRMSEIKGKINAINNRSEELKKEIENKNKEINQIRTEINKYNNAIELLTKIHETLDSVKPTVRRLFLDSVNEELIEMARDIMHKGSYASIEINEDYEIIVRRNDGITLPVDSLSIGERNLVSLFLRYAIARVVMGFIPVLILDEPTEHLDEEHRRRIATWIRNLSNGVRSIIITSHVDVLETIADNIIRLNFINNKGESTFANA